MSHKEIFQKLTPAEKDEFLLSALNSFPKLRKQFEQQFAGKAPKSDRGMVSDHT
jgi:hypothetical protein